MRIKIALWSPYDFFREPRETDTEKWKNGLLLELLESVKKSGG